MVNSPKLGDQQSQQSELPDAIDSFELQNTVEIWVRYYMLAPIALQIRLVSWVFDILFFTILSWIPSHYCAKSDHDETQLLCFRFFTVYLWLLQSLVTSDVKK